MEFETGVKILLFGQDQLRFSPENLVENLYFTKNG
jgi:hypothetical protein